MWAAMSDLNRHINSAACPIAAEKSESGCCNFQLAAVMQRLLLTSNNVQLPGREELCPATIEVEYASGKIIHVRPGKTGETEYYDRDKVEVLDLGDLVVLPGLVEYVAMIFLSSLSYYCSVHTYT
jgi:hypothetical protein